MGEQIYSVSKYGYPLYSQIRELLVIFQGVPKATITSLIQAVWDQRGTPQSQVEWSDPDAWIPQRLSGEQADLARRIWEQSNRKVNPRYLGSDYRFINNQALAIPDSAGVYQITERGQAFLNGDPQFLRRLDEAEGLTRLLTILAPRTRAKANELLAEWTRFLSEQGKSGATSTIKESLRQRLANLVERGFVWREGNTYVITPQGVEYATAAPITLTVPALAATRATVSDSGQAGRETILTPIQEGGFRPEDTRLSGGDQDVRHDNDRDANRGGTRMSTEVTAVTRGYQELEPEVEEATVEIDDRPVSSQPVDWSISALREKYERGQIDLQPHYQREYVWELKPELPSRLVESLLLEIPIPPIYFGKMPGGRLEIIDGQQRLTTLIRFVRNEFALQRLQRLGSLNGKLFRDLTDEHQAKVLDAPIRSVVIDAGRNQNLRYDVFERLNRGSMALNEQELRNCVYRGPFCDLLAELEKDSAWRKVKGGDKPESRFVEREMILRFFAFANRIEHYKGNLKRFLNEYMGTHAPKGPEPIAAQAGMFRQTMQNVYTVFGPNAGRLYSTGTEDHATRDGKWDTKFSVSALDIQASALLGHAPSKVQAAAEQIREAYLFYLLTNPQVRLAISRQPANAAATRLRWFGFKVQVQNILSDAATEPRFFSYEFRRRLFDTNPICAICKNQIHSFEDSTVDHVQPYSKGGKTIPENAQLAHRSCNARKYIQSVEGALGDNPLQEAQILFQVGHFVAAGGVAGVALERHLKRLCDRHQPPIVYGRGDGISKINNMLKEAGVYDITQWRQIQWMGDVRNSCDHAGANPPRREDVDNLIQQVRRFIALSPV
ncbi:MAG TPA: DUF262 domain-containing protein [Herpetosiphonaceae bacterium]|nr:DUF262 domain-containing protein [Herpetosiphonaceae bacterium]